MEPVTRSHLGRRMLLLFGEEPEETLSPCGGWGALGLGHEYPAVPQPFAQPRFSGISASGGACSHCLDFAATSFHGVL